MPLLRLNDVFIVTKIIFAKMTVYSLPLFPLNLVIFPEGLLPLRIFEMRYLDMVRNCLRNQSSFGVVALINESGAADLENMLPFTNVGTSFTIINADVTEPGLMNIRCLGQNRFCVKSAFQQDDGLWIGEVEDIKNDTTMIIPDDLKMTQEYMQQLIQSLSEQDIAEEYLPFAKPFKVNDCAWVANRWCEILSMPLIQKQRMLELDSPLVRLELVQDLLITEFSKK